MNYLISVLTFTAIFSILTLSLNIRYGYTGILDFSIAGFYLIGAVVSGIFTAPNQGLDVMGIQSVVGNFQWTFPAGLLMGILITALLSGIIGLILLKLRGDYFAVASIGIAEIIRWVAINESYLTNGSQGIQFIPVVFQEMSPGHHSAYYLLFVLGVLAVILLFTNRIKNRGFGRTIRTLREDDILLESLGRSADHTFLKSYVVSGIMAGIAGSLWAHYAGSIQPADFKPEVTFMVWMCLMIGGKGNHFGSVLGTVLIVGILEQGTHFLPPIPNYPQALHALRLILIGAMMMVIVRYVPKGILPERIVKTNELG